MLSQYGIVMVELHLKKELEQQRILISNIALELDVTAAFTKHGCLMAEYGSEQGRSAFFKSFQNEAHVLSKIAHRNIVKFYGFCLHKRYMFLICQYMEWGSLFCVLLNDD